MTDSVAARSLAALSRRVSPVALGVVTVVVLAELALVAGYVGLTRTELTSVRYLLYPFVWVNLAVWAVFAADPSDVSTRTRAAALVATVGYFLVLAYLGGVLDVSHFGHGHSHGGPRGLQLFTSLPPGWGPTVVYDHAAFTLTFVPYQFVGYLALTYLVYVALLDLAAAALSGALGLLACASCSWPVFASLLAGVLGSGVTATVYSLAVDLSTAAFVVAVVALVWRPGGT